MRLMMTAISLPILRRATQVEMPIINTAYVHFNQRVHNMVIALITSDTLPHVIEIIIDQWQSSCSVSTEYTFVMLCFFYGI